MRPLQAAWGVAGAQAPTRRFRRVAAVTRTRDCRRLRGGSRRPTAVSVSRPDLTASASRFQRFRVVTILRRRVSCRPGIRAVLRPDSESGNSHGQAERLSNGLWPQAERLSNGLWPKAKCSELQRWHGHRDCD